MGRSTIFLLALSAATRGSCAYTFLPYAGRRPKLQSVEAEHEQHLDAIGVQPDDRAGPFASAEDAAALMQRWLLEYWQCHRLEGGGNSCFEFGGCHKQCWWREAAPTIVFDFESSAESSSDGPALSSLRERAAADRDLSVGSDTTVDELILHASIVSFGANHHYCALRPAKARRHRADSAHMQLDSGGGGGGVDDGGADEPSAAAQAWRWSKLNLPPVITGAGLADGEEDPEAALFNMVAIRSPFLAACVAVAVNVLLGGGVRVGGLAWPPVLPPAWPPDGV